MKVLFYTTHVLWPTHYETELELIQKHIDSGDDVLQSVCNRNLLTCDGNLKHGIIACAYCISRRKRGQRLLTQKPESVPFFFLTQKDREEVGDLKTSFADIEELKQYSIDDFDVGYAVASSLISFLRDPNLDTVKHRDLIRSYVVSAVQLYRSVQNRLDSMKIDRVYVFNGRFAHTRAVFRACASRDAECVIHERGHDMFHYELFLNVLPHVLTNVEQRIRQAWEKSADRSDREEIAAGFFRARAKGMEQAWYSYTSSQKKGLLPAEWDPDLRNIVIFNSSEDEFAALGNEWKNPLYPDQLTAIRRIISSLEEAGQCDCRIYLRMHPNNRTIAPRELAKWHELKSAFLTVIPYDSPIDTYELLRRADTVLTFGSTVGIEAVFWGRPSVLAGLSPYRDLGGTYNASSHEDVIRLLKTDLAPKDKLPAYMYGFYMNTYGVPFTYYQPDGLGKGSYRGVRLDKTRTSILVFARLLLREIVFPGRGTG